MSQAVIERHRQPFREHGRKKIRLWFEIVWIGSMGIERSGTHYPDLDAAWNMVEACCPKSHPDPTIEEEFHEHPEEHAVTTVP